MLIARLLGQYEVLIDDQTVNIPSGSAQSIFAFFLLHPNTFHRREQLAGMFWPDSSETNARSNLRHALWQIRKAINLDNSARIQNDPRGLIYLPQTGDQLDVELFEACTEDEDSIDILRDTVMCYGGELLPGFYAEWVILERERLQAAYERRLGQLVDRLLSEKKWNETLKWGEHWIAIGNTPEPAYRALMLAYAGLGNLSAAAAQYQRCETALENELGVQPCDLTRSTYEGIRKGFSGPDFERSAPAVSKMPTLPVSLDMPERSKSIFVGREAELAELDDYLEKALHGQIQVVFVSGEAGSGKTSLLQEFMKRTLSAHPEMAIGLGMCNALFGQGIPYLPFRYVLDMLAGDIEPLFMNGILSREQVKNLIAYFPLVIQELLEISPGLLNGFLNGASLARRVAAMLPDERSWIRRLNAESTQQQLLTGEQGSSPLLEQYTQVLKSIAEQYPLMIVLDDLQWMDSGTGRLLFHIIRRLQNTRILIGGAYRSEEVALARDGRRHDLEPLLNEFQSSFGKIIIDLDQINDGSKREFVDAFLNSEPNRLDESFREELFQRTRGHPLFTIQLLRNLQERGEIFSNEQGRWVTSNRLNWESLPPRVEGIIAERIGRLDQDLQNLLLTACVEGEHFTVQVLKQVLGRGEQAILQQLSRELEGRQHLVQELGEIYACGRRFVRFQFVHTLIQQYLYRKLGLAERRSLHHKVAESLESLYKDDVGEIAVALAHHYHEAGISDKAMNYLLQAGDQARNLYAHKEAIGHYQQALEYFKRIGAVERTAHTLMKLYLVYHSAFDFQNAQRTLEEYNALWQTLSEHKSTQDLSQAGYTYRLAALKKPRLDPALCDTLFDLGWIEELFCGLVEISEDRNVTPLLSRSWDVLDEGRRYVFHLRQDLLWSDGKPVNAEDFEFAWKRVLDPATNAISASLLYDIRGARDFNQGRVESAEQVGVSASGPHTLEVKLEEPCGYFPYLLGDPILYPVPKHVVEREGKAWSEADKIVTNGAFQLEHQDRSNERTYHFSRNPHFRGSFKGNISHVTLSIYQDELDMYNAFVSLDLDLVEFLIPPLGKEVLQHYQDLGQLQTLPIPFVDAVYFMTDRPPFDRAAVRRAFVLATDREKLARGINNQLPANGGYIPPGLPGHSKDIGLPFDPQEARRILKAEGYPDGRGFPEIGLLINLVGLEKGDALVFSHLQEMWAENLGVTIKKCWNSSDAIDFQSHQDYHCFFIGWLADYPDPASFIQSNYLIEQTHWYDPRYESLVEAGRRTLEQDKRLGLYRQADRILIEEAVVQPLFYGHVYQLQQPWVQRPISSSLYHPQWRNVTIIPH